jgi:hypothetical protein
MELVARPQTLPRPLWERAFRRDLARDAFERRMRKSHGGKGEGFVLDWTNTWMAMTLS